ncbi:MULTISPECIES: hypothetical protein [unclassified Mycolicibacterium]|uniref:hypothetical protein n=1 Tax=unclassified Mycolicibacterium TaxID=2636767 RepID=UPI001BB39094|nr:MULTISPECIES: hypothetical protein [unclassified Mycolicibacterium]
MHAYIAHRGAWLPSEFMDDDDANRRLAIWIKENIGDDEYRNRVIFTPLKSNETSSPKVLAALARNAPNVASRNPGPHRHGLVVAAWPREPQLQECVGRAKDQTLIVFQWGDYLSFDGWATAVQAFNAGTGEPTPPLDEELDEEFRSLLMSSRELSSGAQRGRERHIPQSSMAVFKSAGLDEDFVVTYCIALGYLGDTKNIRNHYRAARG